MMLMASGKHQPRNLPSLLKQREQRTDYIGSDIRPNSGGVVHSTARRQSDTCLVTVAADQQSTDPERSCSSDSQSISRVHTRRSSESTLKFSPGSSNLSSKSFWGISMLKQREEEEARNTPTAIKHTHLPPVTSSKATNQNRLDEVDLKDYLMSKRHSEGSISLHYLKTSVLPSRPTAKLRFQGLLGVPNSHIKRRQSVQLPPLRKCLSEELRKS